MDSISPDAAYRNRVPKMWSAGTMPSSADWINASDYGITVSLELILFITFVVIIIFLFKAGFNLKFPEPSFHLISLSILPSL